MFNLTKISNLSVLLKVIHHLPIFLAEKPDFSVTFTLPGAIKIGDTVTGTVSFRNTSPFTLAPHLVREDVDPSLGIGPITFLLRMVAPGERLSIPFSVTGISENNNACITAGVSAFSTTTEDTFDATETKCVRVF